MDKKKNAERSKKKERLLDAIYKATTDGILVIGTDYRILDHNQAIAKMAGKKDLIGWPCYRISHGYDTPCWNHGVECPLKNVIQTGKKSVTFHAHKSGEKIVYENISAYPLKDADGRMIGAVEYLKDVTKEVDQLEKLKALNKELEQSRNAYDRLQDIAKNVISHQAPDGTIVQINKMFKEMLGDGVGKPLFEFVHPDDRGMAHRIVKNLSQGKGSSFEARALGKKGKMYLMSGYIVPVFENGKIAGSVSASKDVTEERAAELKLKDTLHELENANKALRDAYHGLAIADKEREDLIRIATHEAKTPLVPILGYADMLRSSEGLTAEQKKYAERIYDNAVRAVELSKKLFQVSKIKENALRLTLSEESPREIVEHSAAMVKDYARIRGISLITNTGKNMPKVALDKNKIDLVLDNLLNNAIKFTNRGGRIEVGAKDVPEKGEIQFWVKDTGIGIKKEHMEQLFTEFYQVDASLSRNFEGVGVGLSICRGILLAHGGKIWAESEYGKGAKFIFTIPVSGNL